MSFINIQNLFIPEAETDNNTWADYIEIFCLLKTDHAVNEAYFYDKVGDDTLKERLKGPPLNSSSDDQNEFLFSDEDPFSAEIENPSEIDDRLATKIAAKFSFARARANLFDADYPFSWQGDTLRLQEISTLTNKQKMYIVLLASSLLRLIVAKRISESEISPSFRMAHWFEELCGIPFEKLLPQECEKHLFGAGSSVASRYNGNFYNKVCALAKDLNLSPHPRFTSQNSDPGNYGDGGLDWVGWFPFKDAEDRMPFSFAQCACGSGWDDKIGEASIPRWGNLIVFSNPPSIIHFIPHSFRDTNSKWQMYYKLEDVIVIDRVRLLELTNEIEAAQILLPYKTFLSEVLTKPPLVDYYT